MKKTTLVIRYKDKGWNGYNLAALNNKQKLELLEQIINQSSEIKDIRLKYTKTKKK